MFPKWLLFTILSSLALIYAQIEPMLGKDSISSINISETIETSEMLFKANTIQTMFMSSMDIFTNTTTLFSNLDDIGTVNQGWFSTADTNVTNSSLYIEIATDIEIRDYSWTISHAMAMGSFYSFTTSGSRVLPNVSDITYNIRVYYVCNGKPGDLVSGAQRFNISTFNQNITVTNIDGPSPVTISISPPIILKPERYFISVQANIDDSKFKRFVLHRTKTRWVNYGPFMIDNENHYGRCDDPAVWHPVQSCLFMRVRDITLALLGPATTAPTENPTLEPTAVPTLGPITFSPTIEPTFNPTTVPTSNPTPVPTSNPTAVPTFNPTAVPTFNPTSVPTFDPTSVPTYTPTITPTSDPTNVPSSQPTASPICGDNTNSGPLGDIQCENDDWCCPGFKCNVKKGKCSLIRNNAIMSYLEYMADDDNVIAMILLIMLTFNTLISGYCCCCCVYNKVCSKNKPYKKVLFDFISESEDDDLEDVEK